MSKIILAVMGIMAVLFLVVVMSTLIGGIVGWIVGMVFPFVIVTLNTLTDLTLTGFEFGAVLGFVGSFFKSSQNIKEIKHNV